MKKTIVITLMALAIYFLFIMKDSETSKIVNTSNSMVDNRSVIKIASNKTIEKLTTIVNKQVRAEQAYDNVENEWNKEAGTFFENSFKQYSKMRNDYENDRLLLIETYHARMLIKYGKNVKLHISDLETLNEVAELNKKYSSKLIRLIGETKYTRYLTLRDKFNERFISRHENQSDFIEIEF